MVCAASVEPVSEPVPCETGREASAAAFSINQTTSETLHQITPLTPQQLTKEEPSNHASAPTPSEEEQNHDGREQSLIDHMKQHGQQETVEEIQPVVSEIHVVSNESIAKEEAKDHIPKNKKKRMKYAEDNDVTENDMVDLDDDFTPEELEVLKEFSNPSTANTTQWNQYTHELYEDRTRLTLAQQQEVLFSLNNVKLNEDQKKELMLLGDVLVRIGEQQLVACSIFESVNIYCFILAVSTFASIIGTLAMGLIYFVVFKSESEGVLSVVVSGLFVLSFILGISLCVLYNVKNRSKHRERKEMLRHYHEVIEEAIFKIHLRFFMCMDRKQLRKNRNRELLSEYAFTQLVAFIQHPIESDDHNIWCSLCCLFGGLCTLIAFVILLMFSFICLFFPTIFKRSVIVPIFTTIPTQVGYGVVGGLALSFFLILCFMSAAIFCYFRGSCQGFIQEEQIEEGTSLQGETNADEKHLEMKPTIDTIRVSESQQALI